jgi:acyl CoA:acetate/3-ketoacid CoA transferase
MTLLSITAGPFTFEARLETALAPKTCAAFEKSLPYDSQLVHVRWSGEGIWIPLGDHDFGVDYENHTSHPAPGQFILYPGGISETEILLAYGGVDFSSKMGQLAGNHFITITSNQDKLMELGNLVLWYGAQAISFMKR